MHSRVADARSMTGFGVVGFNLRVLGFRAVEMSGM